MRLVKKSLSTIFMTGKAIHFKIFRAGIHGCCIPPQKSDRPFIEWDGIGLHF
jgi:hypothetical protein